MVEVYLHFGGRSLFAVNRQRIDFGQSTYGLARNLYVVTESRGFAVASYLQVITANLRDTLFYREYRRIGSLFHSLTVAVEQFPVGRIVTRIDVRDFEALVRFDCRLVDLNVVGRRVLTHIHILAPGDFGIALHVDRNGSNTQTDAVRTLQVGRNRIVHTGPRRSDTHKDRLFILLLSIELEHRSVYIEVVNRLAQRLGIVHFEDDLGIYALVVRSQHFGYLDDRSGRSSHLVTRNREFAQVEFQILGVLKVESNHGNIPVGQRSQSTTDCKGLLYPHFVVGLAIGNRQYLETRLTQNCGLVTNGRESQIDVGLTTDQFVTNRNLIARSQRESRLEEVQIFIGCRTEDAQTRTAYISIVEGKLGIQTIGYHLVGRFAQEFGSKPETPGRQIVLYTNVVPLVVVLTFAHPVEELTVTQIEIGDERLGGQIPAERAASGHKGRHTEPAFVGVVAATIEYRNLVNRVTTAVREELLDYILITQLFRHIGTTIVGTVGPQHVEIVSAPQTDRNIVVLE